MEGTERRVAVILEANSQYSARLMEGVLRYTEEHHHLRLLALDFEFGHPPRWLKPLPEFDGILFWASASERWLEPLFRSGIPAVSASGNWHNKQGAVVAFSAEEAIRMAVEYLARLRRRCIASVIYNSGDDPYFHWHQEIFMRQAAEFKQTALTLDLGRQRSVERNPPALTAGGKKAFLAFLRKLPLPAAIWTINDYLGHTLVEVAQEARLKVPEQVAILGMGDYPVARYCRPQLSTLPQPGEVIGFESLRLLDAIMAGHPPESLIIKVPSPPIIERGSTRVDAPDDDSLEQAHAFIEEHACQGIVVDEVLKITSLSLPTFNKRFVAKYGVTPGVAIRRVKVARAQYYLRTTGLSITRIADLCGFNQPAKFSNFFKRETGQTPSFFRGTSKPDE